MEYFWYSRPSEGHPPPAIRDPAELTDSDRVAISCTQTRLPPSRQRALVREWCDVLPRLQGVRLLWLTSRASQPLFDAACRVPGLEGLYIKWSGVKTLGALEHAVSLKYFHLGGSPGIESLDPISDSAQLTVLGIENLKKIHDLSPLAALGGLEELAVEGSTWATQCVDTLAPLAALVEHRFLSLVNLRASDRTLRPLFFLRKLRGFRAAQWWDPAELAELRWLNPALSGECRS